MNLSKRFLLGLISISIFTFEMAAHLDSLKQEQIILQDSIPHTKNETRQRIIERELLDTIIIFDPETFTETIKVVKSIRRDTITILDPPENQIINSPVERDGGTIEIFKIVEQMPRFPGCEHLGVGIKEVESCAREEMLKYIYSNLEYPKSALTQKNEANVHVQFVVKKDGSVSDIQVVKNIGEGIVEIEKAFMDAAIKVVESMNTMSQKWIPGVQNGKKVDIKYTLPIIFKVDQNKD